MRYYFFLKRKNNKLKSYKYNMRHLAFRNLCPKEMLHAFRSTNRIKLINKLAKYNIDHIELLGYLLNKINNDFIYRKKIIKMFKRYKSGILSDKKISNKKFLLVQSLEEKMSEIYNFEFKQEDINTYDKLFQ